MKSWCRLVGLLTICGASAATMCGANLAWVELITSGSPASSAVFYEKTFGWTAERTAGADDWDAVVLLRGGKPVAGVAHREGERMAKARTRWVGFFEVADLAATEAAIGLAGGRVVEAAHSGAARSGRQALMADREGAIFGVTSGVGSEASAGRGFWPVALAVETPAAAKFYREVLGGDVRAEARTPLFAGDFLLTDTGGPWAGVQPASVGGRAGWLILIGVADIDATVKTARKEGARVLREPLVDLIGGRVAVLSDPQGGIFGLYETFPVRAPVKTPRDMGKTPAAASATAEYEVETLSR